MYCRGLILIFFHILFILAAVTAMTGDLFTSVHDMEALAHQEERLKNTLSDYISNQRARLKLLRTKLKQLANVKPADQTVQHIIADPINAFSLVRRLTREWPLILNLMVNNIAIHEELALLPKEENLESAVRGLMRLQDVYRLDTKQLAQHGTSPSVLTALNCFEIGNYAFKENQYEVAKSWFNEALEKVANGDTTVLADKVLVHLFLASQYSDCKAGSKSGSASNVLQNLMSQYPKYTLDQDSAQLFRQALPVNCSKPDQSANTEMMEVEEFYDHTFSEACRGYYSHFPSTLRCFYINYNNPRLLIAPFKMEELHLNPPVLMFHDVVSDHEIEEMKTVFSKVREKCGTVDWDESKKIEYYRTCDVGWVEDHTIESSARLTRRVGDMTNLMMESSEYNQVASYGLGGEFMLHYDPIPSDALSSTKTNGSRIATLMFYLNDVVSGGFTVFPRIHVTVRPQKGSAVFWFNLNHRSEQLDDMLHGGCPILMGSKWVLNKWIHEGGQKSEIFCPSDEIFPKPRYYLNGQ